MDKIVLICEKMDDRFQNLVNCLKYLFPECSLELIRSEKKTVSKNRRNFTEAFRN